MITLGNVTFFLIWSMVWSLLDQMQIFWQLHLIELLGVLNDQLVLNGNSSQEYPVYAGVSNSFILGSSLFLLYIKDLMMFSIILLSMLMILLIQVWSRIWSMATTTIDFCNRIWYPRHCGRGQEVVYWFECWKNLTAFFWLV